MRRLRTLVALSFALCVPARASHFYYDNEGKIGLKGLNYMLFSPSCSSGDTMAFDAVPEQGGSGPVFKLGPFSTTFGAGRCAQALKGLKAWDRKCLVPSPPHDISKVFGASWGFREADSDCYQVRAKVKQDESYLKTLKWVTFEEVIEKGGSD
jgi:hypothetical protein